MTISFSNEREIKIFLKQLYSNKDVKKKIFLNEGKLRECHRQTYPRRMNKGSSLSRKEIIRGGNLEFQEGRKNTVRKKISIIK